MSARVSAIAALVLTLVAAGCRRVEPASGGAALMRNLLRARELEVVVEERLAREPLERAAARLRKRDRFRFDAVVHAGPSTGSAPRIVVGTESSQLAARLARSIGVEAGPGQFRYGKRDFAGVHDGLVATFADPERRGLPITLVFANDASAAVELAGSLLPGWKPWIRVMRAGDVVLAGPLDVDGAPRPPDLVRVGGAQVTTRESLDAQLAIAPGVVVRAQAGMSPDVVARYGQACLHARENVAGWCVTESLIIAVDVRVWSRADDYSANGDARSLSRFDPADGQVDALVSPAFDDGGAGVARAGAWTTLGPPAQPWMLDGAGVDAAWTWWGRGLDPWLARVLLCTSSAPEPLRIADLIDPQALERTSGHVVSPLRGALWRYLREREGVVFVRELWSGTRALDVTPELDAAFASWLHARTESQSAEDALARERAHADTLALPILRGVGTCERSFDERDGVRHGYGSRAFENGVTEARARGADALLVTAFGCYQPGLPPLFGDECDLQLGLLDGDVRVASSIAFARASGMRALLAPELLTADGGTWAGTWSRGNRGQWAACFERHARFVEHVGLLAELAGANVLSIGSGLASISGRASEGRRPVAAEAEWKRDGWKRVIGAARAAFSGGLVYSATSIDELDKIAFFPDLDFIGFQMAPTLEFDDPWDGKDAVHEVRQQIMLVLNALTRVAAENDKRILLTQVCFWPDLHGAARVMGSRSASAQWHARQFGLFAGSLSAWSGRDRLAGLFVWRWPAGDEAGSNGAHDPVIDAPAVREQAAGVLRGL